MKIIGIAGGSGTGKTTVANAVGDVLSATIISLDSYYNDNSHVSPTGREHLNFDHPSAFDFDLLFEHLNLLKKGFSIDIPFYSYIERTRLKKTRKVKPDEIILIEGILLYHDKRVIDLLDYKFFIDLEEKKRLENIIKRDTKERGRSENEIIERFYREVNPMHKQFIEGQKPKADLVLKDTSLNNLINVIINHLKFNKLC